MKIRKSIITFVILWSITPLVFKRLDDFFIIVIYFSHILMMFWILLENAINDIQYIEFSKL